MFTCVAWEFLIKQGTSLGQFLSSDLTLCLKKPDPCIIVIKCWKKLWNVQPFKVETLTEARSNHYCNKCSKWRSIPRTQARRCRLHSSVTSLTTVCCTPDQTALRRCSSWSFESFKSYNVVFVYPFVANSFTDILSPNRLSHTEFKNKLWFSLHTPISVISVAWCKWLQWK